MRKNLTWLFLALATVIMGVSFASCGGDDDNDTPNPGTGEKATEATMQTGVYVSESTLKYFDVVITDANGNSVKITSENTELVNDTVFGMNLDHYKDYMASRTNTTDNRLRLYTTSAETFKSFPVSREYKIVATPNGVVPGDEEKVYVIMYPDIKASNNTKEGSLSGLNFSGSYTSIGAITGKNWDKVKTFNKSVKYTLEKADNVSGSING